MKKCILGALITLPLLLLGYSAYAGEYLGFLDLRKNAEFEVIDQKDLVLPPKVGVTATKGLQRKYARLRIFGLAKGTYNQKKGRLHIVAFEPKVYDPLNLRKFPR